jgi:hypothetical protein
MRTFLVIWFAVLPALAQEFRGRISGTITDPNDAVVAAARVRVVNVETKVAQQTVSNETGEVLAKLRKQRAKPKQEHLKTFGKGTTPA